MGVSRLSAFDHDHEHDRDSMFVLGGSNSGSMPHNLKMSDMADSPKMTNEQWQQFNRLLQEKDPELGRVMKNAVRPPPAPACSPVPTAY